MRVCLVSPAWEKLVNSYPPLGLTYLAACLEQAGHQVSIQDFNLPPNLTLEAQAEKVADFKPDLVGITCMSHVYNGARALARRLKETVGCSVVLGGPHPTIFKDALLEEASIDFVVYGEGEDTLPELARALEQGLSLETIVGLCWRNQGQPVRNPPRTAITDLGSLPFPARHLLRLKDYPLRAPDGALMATIITSRGCPYDCSFCYKGLFGRTYRQRSVENVIGEMKEVIQSYQISNFYFIDDLFTLNQKWLHDFTRSVIGEELNVRWKCLARVDRVTLHTLREMRQAGCREVHYGIESGDEVVLKRISKNLSLSQVRQAVAWTRQAGMLVKGYFMLGLPEDTEETIRKTMSLAGQLDLDEAMFSLTTPFPGTRLWQDLAAVEPQVLKQDLSSAYYYNMNGGEVLPFMNVSTVPDGKLARLCREAADKFRLKQEKVWYEDRLGRTWGGILWQVSRVRGFRKVSRILHQRGLLPALPGEKQFQVRRWA